MIGLRSQQRFERREAILAAASKLFEAHGYARTTFKQIASTANMGLSTIYKYFGSKQDLVRAILDPEFNGVIVAGERIIMHPPKDAARAVILLLREYSGVKGHKWARRDLLKMTIFPGLGNEGILGSFVAFADERIEGQIFDLLSRLRERRLLEPKLDLKDASSIIFAIFNQHFAHYLLSEKKWCSESFIGMERQIKVLFENWVASRVK